LFQVFAHNMSGFDGQFVLSWLLNEGVAPTVIRQGLNVVSMRFQDILLLDSFKFLPLPLSGLPKAFGFDDQVLKGFFPHLFNTIVNQDYDGPMPPQEMYGRGELMSPERNLALESW
jgi:hypothetical protein